MTSKEYTYSPTSASDYVGLGLVSCNNVNDNVVKFVQFSGKVDWETTVQFLETCLWNRQKNEANAFLTHLRCLYYINGNINHIPTSTLQSQYDRPCYPSSSLTSLSSSPTSSAHSIGEGDVLEEPRLKELTLPRWGPHQSFYSFYTMDGTYLNSLIVDQPPYLVQFYPRSLRHERFLEDEFDGTVAAADIAN